MREDHLEDLPIEVMNLKEAGEDEENEKENKEKKNYTNSKKVTKGEKEKLIDSSTTTNKKPENILHVKKVDSDFMKNIYGFWKDLSGNYVFSFTPNNVSMSMLSFFEFFCF